MVAAGVGAGEDTGGGPDAGVTWAAWRTTSEPKGGSGPPEAGGGMTAPMGIAPPPLAGGGAGGEAIGAAGGAPETGAGVAAAASVGAGGCGGGAGGGSSGADPPPAEAIPELRPRVKSLGPAADGDGGVGGVTPAGEDKPVGLTGDADAPPKPDKPDGGDVKPPKPPELIGLAEGPPPFRPVSGRDGVCGDGEVCGAF